MKIAIASDHGGFNLKGIIKSYLQDAGHSVQDFGPDTPVSTDYPEYALKVAREMAGGAYDFGILICGTGLGMSMAANRIRGVRAALCTNEFMARMAKAHNNANVLCLGERSTGPGLALSILEAWLATDFEGGRHKRRIDIFDHAG